MAPSYAMFVSTAARGGVAADSPLTSRSVNVLKDKLKRSVKKPLAPRRKPVAPRAKIQGAERKTQQQAKARKK